MAFWGDKKKAAEVHIADVKVRDIDAPREVHTDKVVIVTGPTLGTVLGFVALGAALGAGAALALAKNQYPTSSNEEDAVYEGVSAGGGKPPASRENLRARAGHLAERVKHLAGKAKETVQSASEIVSPALQDALNEARTAARQAQEELEMDLKQSSHKTPPDRAEAKRDVVATGSVAVGVPAGEAVEVEVPANAEVEVPTGTRPVEVTEPLAEESAAVKIKPVD